MPQARDLVIAGKDREALRLYEQIVALDPRNGVAHFRIVSLSWKLLPGWKMDVPAERKQAQWLINIAFSSLHMLDKLDRGGTLLERHLFRGLLNAHLYRQDKSEELRVVAERELQRFVDQMKANKKGDDPNVDLARRWLARVKKKKKN